MACILIRLLKASGFRDLSFYYPHPDYKLPREIFSDNALPQPGRRLEGAPNYDQERLVLFDEPRVWQTILNAGQFPLFANSFLVLARPDPSLRGTP